MPSHLTELSTANEPISNDHITEEVKRPPRPRRVVDIGLLNKTEGTEGRPLLPSISLSELQASVLGGSSSKRLPLLFEALGNTISIYKPSVPLRLDSPDPSTLPILLYLPGIDGTGLAAYKQFPEISLHYDLRNLFMPPDDRTPFAALVDRVCELIEEELEAEMELTSPESLASRPVYLLGESFGGLLALAVGDKSPYVDRIVLVNPATSFSLSAWPMLGPALTSLPPEVYNLLPIALSPILTNPLAVALNGVQLPSPFPFPLPFPPRFPPNFSDLAGKGTPLRAASDLAYGLIELLPTLGALRDVLPPSTLTWRLSLLKEGSSYVNNILGQVQQRTLLLTGSADLVIPSASEGPRLQRALPRCRLRPLPGRSHAMLQEAGVSLVQLIQEEGFYVKVRNLSSSSVVSSQGRPPAHSTDTRGLRGGLTRGGATFGRPLPLELPTSIELKAAMESGGLSSLKSIVSPVFFSTNPTSGAIEKGLQHLPLGQGRPILFVGNHQLFAPDMPLMIAEILEKRGTLLRGLAHPFALDGFGDDLIGGDGGGASFGPSSIGSFLKTFGAVRVGGPNLYKLLQQGEAALLFPGGAREAYKMRGEKYKLLWPQAPEFVRLAARFGAIIVPFSAIGAEDVIEIAMDSRELKEVQEGVEGAGSDVNPLLRALVATSSRISRLQKNATGGRESGKEKERAVPLARTGVKALSEEEKDLIESFQPPLITLNQPHRFYFVFREPIETRPDMSREETSAIYDLTKREVEAGIEYLRVKAKSDPYSNVIDRMLFEASWNGKRQAPTFDP